MKILYGVCGEGFGHSSRAKVIINHLQKKGHKVLIITYGKAYPILKNFNTIKVEGITLSFKKERLSLQDTISYNIKTMDKVVHFEIPADDIERAQKFYKEIFGWGIQKIDMPGGNAYYMVHTVEVDEQHMPKESGAINGGMLQRSPQGEGPIIVINVPSIDEKIVKITAAGGSVIMAKAKIMEMGHYARVKDSEGNIIGLWEDVRK